MSDWEMPKFCWYKEIEVEGKKLIKTDCGQIYTGEVNYTELQECPYCIHDVADWHQLELERCPQCNATEEGYKHVEDLNEPWERVKPRIIYFELLSYGKWVISCDVCDFMIAFPHDTNWGASNCWNNLPRRPIKLENE